MEPKIVEKRWSKEIEESIVTEWKKSPLYRFNKKSKKKVYSIDTPPPYVNTPVHMGHAATYAVMDMIARFKRMTGHEILFPLGLDRNGLPIEMQAEKKYSKKLTECTREEFINYCEAVLKEATAESVDTFFKEGICFNSWEKGNEPGDVYETDSPEYRALTQETFIDLWNKKLIYEDERINNYCPGCQTTIADAEIEYKELSTLFTDVKFKVKETGEEIIIGTTRPEFLFSCAMVLFNPADTRYSHLSGKTAIVPVSNLEVPIKSHTAAEMETGTGLVMMCSFGDNTDVRFFREEGITPIILINTDGTMNDKAGFLKGMKTSDARKAMLEELGNRGLIAGQRQISHRTPICERSKDQIEFIGMKEFYLKQVQFKDDMRKLADKMNFFAPESKQILLNWIDSVSIDWPISRRRYYATEIPLWYCDQCKEIIVPPKGKYYKPWKEQPPVKKCKCGSTNFRGEERVFDTWFDSSISPLYILKYSRDDKFFKKNTPCSLRPQGKEIVRTWLYYTVLKDYLLTGKCIFNDVWIHQHITDEKGYKMSKSKGNVIDPKEVIAKSGAESLRLWVAIEGNLEKQDFKCSFERIDGAGKTLTKLWNVARFVSMFPEPKGKHELTDIDKWIINEINSLAKIAKERYTIYDFHNPAVQLKHFLWETFASHYLELVKNRAYNENEKFTKESQNGALYTLNYCLDIMLKLFAPIIPMATYKIFMDLRKKDIHAEEFPEAEKEQKIPFTADEIVKLNSEIWKIKKDSNKSLKEEVAEAVLPKNLETIKEDLISTHNIKKVSFGETKIMLK